MHCHWCKLGPSKCSRQVAHAEDGTQDGMFDSNMSVSVHTVINHQDILSFCCLLAQLHSLTIIVFWVHIYLLYKVAKKFGVWNFGVFFLEIPIYLFIYFFSTVWDFLQGFLWVSLEHLEKKKKKGRLIWSVLRLSLIKYMWFSEKLSTPERTERPPWCRLSNESLVLEYTGLFPIQVILYSLI